MEKDGIVKRTIVHTTCVRCLLTDAGRRLINEIMENIKAEEQSVLSLISEEENQTLTDSEKMRIR